MLGCHTSSMKSTPGTISASHGSVTLLCQILAYCKACKIPQNQTVGPFITTASPNPYSFRARNSSFALPQNRGLSLFTPLCHFGINLFTDLARIQQHNVRIKTCFRVKDTSAKISESTLSALQAEHAVVADLMLDLTRVTRKKRQEALLSTLGLSALLHVHHPQQDMT